MTPTRPIRTAMKVVVPLLAALVVWQAIVVDAASVTPFAALQRVKVTATGELATIDHLSGNRVVIYGDASGAQLRALAPEDLEAYPPPAPPPATTPTTPPATTTSTTPRS